MDNSTRIESVTGVNTDESAAIILGSLLFVSEILPLLPWFKNNGLVHTLVLIIQKLKN